MYNNCNSQDIHQRDKLAMSKIYIKDLGDYETLGYLQFRTVSTTMASFKLKTAIFTFIIAIGAIEAYRQTPPKCEDVEDHFTLFPADDPRAFYVCLPDGNPKLVECGPEQVFVDSSDVYGCAPFEYSPCAKNYKPINCSPGADRNTLVVSQDPHKYWVCSAPDGIPVEVPCPGDKGFVKNGTIMGCTSWAEWSC